MIELIVCPIWRGIASLFWRDEVGEIMRPNSRMQVPSEPNEEAGGSCTLIRTTLCYLLQAALFGLADRTTF